MKKGLRHEAHALEAIGEGVPAHRIEVLLTKARVISGSPTRDLLKHLKREYAMGLLEEKTEETALSTRSILHSDAFPRRMATINAWRQTLAIEHSISTA